jgi:hypothetical protein
MDTAKGKRWFPLESNPLVMNEYIKRMGFLSDSEYCFCDVYSTDDWALDNILRPVLAVIMLFPIKEKVIMARILIHIANNSTVHLDGSVCKS